MKNKGITLIALIITIIILLILAGISIATLTGDEGILTKTEGAKGKNDLESLKEEAKLMLSERKIEDKTGQEKRTLKEDLEKQISGNKVIEGVKDLTDVYYVTRDGKTITVYEDGTIEEGKVDIWDGESKTKPEIDEEKNWHIYTTKELKYFADFVNGKEEKGDLTITETTTIYLENNLDLGARQKDGEKTNGTAWTEIGTDTTNSFKGIFEGNNHTIRGVYVNKTGQYVGLFGHTTNIIQNLTIKNSYIVGGSAVGGIAGWRKNNK